MNVAGGFIFHSDVNDHKDSSGYKMIEKVMLISQAEAVA
jgi:hypothetical protein